MKPVELNYLSLSSVGQISALGGRSASESGGPSGEHPTDQSEARDGGGDQSEGRVSQHERSKDLLLWGEITKSRVNHLVTGSGTSPGKLEPA